jgi:peptide/nickel transport system substrate-binding protein
VTDTQPQKEFRLKSGPTVLNYIKRFSATEKAIFGVLIIIAAVTAVAMAVNVNSYFMTEIPGNDGHLTEGVVGLPHTVNPILAVTDVDRDLTALIYSGLTTYKNGAFIPDLAASSSISRNGLTYTFTLKDGLRFQDDTPLTSADVAYTIQMIQDPALKSPLRADWKDVTVKIVSPTIIQFTLKQPYSPFISNTAVGIIPKHIWGPLNNDQFALSQYNIEPIGSGPYKESSIGKTGGGIPSSYTVSTWSGYYDAKPHIQSITFKFYADEEKALTALDNGSIDSLPSISASDASKLASDTAQAYKIISSPLPRVFGVFFNQSQAPVLADQNVRIALNMVVDRKTIIQTALNGYGQSIYGPLPFDTGGNSGASSSASRSLAAARNLLEKNGWKRDPLTGIYGLAKKGSKTIQTLSFDIFTADTPDLKQTAELVKNSWNALGAQVDVKVFEPSDLYQNVISTRKYDALLFGEFIGSDRDLFAFWHSSERNSPGLNVALYANSKADKLLESIRNTALDSAREDEYSAFAQLISADMPAVFLYMPDFIYAVPKSLHGVDLRTVTIPSDRFNSIANWYDTTDKVWKIFAY